MAKAIETVANMTVGHFGLGKSGVGTSSPKAAVHDGDTITVAAIGNMGLRFLGVDTPEISFQLPGSQAFLRTDHAKWESFLTDPFSSEYGPLRLDADLKRYLQTKLGPGCAANHHRHAALAERALEAEVQADAAGMNGQPAADLRLYLRFAREVMDGYGRLLAYANRDEPAAPLRPPSYNERGLAKGFALPYFIWPNINPFRRQSSLSDAVLRPGSALDVAEGESSLRAARQAVAHNRAQGIGLFAADGPLRLEAFELRYLAQRKRPARWVIDLSREGNRLTHPERYFEIPNPEDRLFIPEEYVEFFVARGWVRQGI